MSSLTRSSAIEAPYKTFSDLPTELLWQIVEWVCLLERKQPPLGCRKYRTIHRLATVNRQLFEIAQLLLDRDVVCDTREDLSAFVWCDAINDTMLSGRIRYVSLLGTLRLLSNEHTYRTLRVGLISNWILCSGCIIERASPSICVFPFVNLTTFICLRSPCDNADMSALSKCQKLKTLIVTWKAPQHFPNLEFPSLAVLRLHAVRRGYYRTGWDLPCKQKYDSITTLVLGDHASTSYSHALSTCVKDISFPQLRVFVLNGVDTTTQDLYAFIQRHPSLLEVTVAACMFSGLGPFCLKDLIPFIGGIPSSASDDYYGYTTDRYTEAIFFSKFSFKRVAITEDDPTWTASGGASGPKFRCSAFAVQTPGYWRSPTDVEGDTLDFNNVTLELTMLQPGIEELRVSVDDSNAPLIETVIAKRLVSHFRTWGSS